jgi:hypothetical protein
MVFVYEMREACERGAGKGDALGGRGGLDGGGRGWYYHMSYLMGRRWSSLAEYLSVVE